MSIYGRTDGHFYLNYFTMFKLFKHYRNKKIQLNIE